MPKFSFVNGCQVTDRGITARTMGPLLLGHMGCGLVSRLRPTSKNPVSESVTDFLDAQYDTRKTWTNSKDATKKLGNSLQALVEKTERGLCLVDTMRRGSDAWRPGSFLTKAAEIAVEGNESNCAVTYFRSDCFCPSSNLLSQFREDSDMSFADYASKYARELEESKTIELAAAFVVEENARNRVPLFYCTNPYIRGYVSADSFLEIPYSNRRYPEFLRNEGCHRVVLVEEIVKFFLKNGVRIEMYEIDQHCKDGFHLRQFEA